MPGELGNEEEQQGVGYYEHRYAPDDDPNMEPPGDIESMRKRPNNKSVMKVLRDFTEDRMKAEQGKVQEY